MTKHELRIYINEAYERASKIGLGNTYIGWGEKDELIRNAKYYRKLIIQKSFPAFKVDCKDEETNQLVWVNINKDYSLKEIILILVAKNFYMTCQQIGKFIIIKN